MASMGELRMPPDTGLEHKHQMLAVNPVSPDQNNSPPEISPDQPSPDFSSSYTPTDRSLPPRDVNSSTLDSAFVTFILYCNPSFPLDVDVTQLRVAFCSPPQSEGKTFDMWRLYTLYGQHLRRQIKTWTDLVRTWGVRLPSEGQSAQKVQQYSSRLKRWMQSLHVTAFFDYLYHRDHSYYLSIPDPSQPVPDKRDGTEKGEDQALRSLNQTSRSRRGRQKIELGGAPLILQYQSTAASSPVASLQTSMAPDLNDGMHTNLPSALSTPTPSSATSTFSAWRVVHFNNGGPRKKPRIDTSAPSSSVDNTPATATSRLTMSSALPPSASSFGSSNSPLVWGMDDRRSFGTVDSPSGTTNNASRMRNVTTPASSLDGGQPAFNRITTLSAPSSATTTNRPATEMAKPRHPYVHVSAPSAPPFGLPPTPAVSQPIRPASTQVAVPSIGSNNGTLPPGAPFGGHHPHFAGPVGPSPLAKGSLFTNYTSTSEPLSIQTTDTSPHELTTHPTSTYVPSHLALERILAYDLAGAEYYPPSSLAPGSTSNPTSNSSPLLEEPTIDSRPSLFPLPSTPPAGPHEADSSSNRTTTTTTLLSAEQSRDLASALLCRLRPQNMSESEDSAWRLSIASWLDIAGWLLSDSAPVRGPDARRKTVRCRLVPRKSLEKEKQGQQESADGGETETATAAGAGDDAPRVDDLPPTPPSKPAADDALVHVWSVEWEPVLNGAPVKVSVGEIVLPAKKLAATPATESSPSRKRAREQEDRIRTELVRKMIRSLVED